MVHPLASSASFCSIRANKQKHVILCDCCLGGNPWAVFFFFFLSSEFHFFFYLKLKRLISSCVHDVTNLRSRDENRIIRVENMQVQSVGSNWFSSLDNDHSEKKHTRPVSATYVGRPLLKAQWSGVGVLCDRKVKDMSTDCVPTDIGLLTLCSLMCYSCFINVPISSLITH